MKNLWSIRMRASKTVKSQRSKLKTQNSKYTEIHISGAEGLYEATEIQRVVRRYVQRALNHSRGQADKIIITIEDIKQKPQTITALPVVTIENATPKRGREIAQQLLQASNVSRAAIEKAFGLIKKTGMRGAALFTAGKGKRLEPHRERGIRVSRLGITKSAIKHLSSRLLRYGINTETVQEAIILASKVLSCKHVIAELCMSDDPDYTTGYVATRKFGYVRIPHIKKKGNRSGGRVFFVREGIDVEDVATYLEKRPGIVGKVSCCRGIIPFDEILSHSHM
jgi:6-carboxyhexanoate--CoA ligase